MAVTPIVRPGQQNLTGSAESLFLELFSGEVLTAFHQKNKLMQYTRTRTISGGKSATFPLTGTATARYHTVGASVFNTDDGEAGNPAYLSNIATGERDIHVDDPIVSGVFVSNIDEMKNAWDVRSIYTNEIATALSDIADGNIARTILAAAVADPQAAHAQFSSMTLAEKTMDMGASKTGAVLAQAIFDTAELFDKHNIPEEGRVVLLDPDGYYKLAAEKDLVNKDFTAGMGDYAQAKIMKVAGFDIVMTNSLPSSDEATAYTLQGEKNDPFGGGKGYKPGANLFGTAMDASKLGGLAFQSGAIGTVKMKELSTASEYYLERQGSLLLSSYIMGHDVLRPECAIAFEYDTSA
ncbi:MAG: putative minor capsid protein 10B [Prokaryotic dsDNA virus sp.]|nr:MAG: putative minor capsid protein 10B [Prokaryotic dsDNA virus sp.]|tara:strand:- start:24484 stop:25539 length:1056 start_codon:yes stop_codon:yes gene_type:complete